MLYQIVVAAGLTLFALNLALNLRNLRRPRGEAELPRPVPLVSILVPARDEELNIAACLASLQGQEYPRVEILVLDDGSSDGTASIVEGIAARDERVALIRGTPLPPGWAGKPFACYQLARRAAGSWLLFVDADTLHAPRMLRAVLTLAGESRASLLSGFPQQLAYSLPQKAAIPVLYFVILSWLPLWWLQRAVGRRPSLAIGQFLLFRREEYWRIGGHEAVKSRILEDVWLGVEVARHGGRHVAVDLSPVVACRMYSSIGPMWEGFVKWVHSVAALSTVGLLGLVVAGYVFFLAPFYWLWNELFVVATPSDWRWIVVLQVAVIFLARRLLGSRFEEPVVSTLLHPIGFSFLFLAGLYALLQHVLGAGIHWKKRLYSSGSGVR